MKFKVTNLRSIKEALNSIPDGLLDAPPQFIGVDGMKLDHIEVTTEEFLVNKTNSDDAGYPSELKRKGKFDKDEYNVVDPIGTVLLHMER